jgi:hypothetical protein
MQYKLIWNCHNESSLYNEYILIKKFNGKKRFTMSVWFTWLMPAKCKSKKAYGIVQRPESQTAHGIDSSLNLKA